LELLRKEEGKLGLFKKKKDVSIYAPVSGMRIDLTEVKDEMFSQKILGDGFAVVPEDDIFGAPGTGEVSMIFDTSHAFCITMDDGKELMVHIGLETVALKGEGFTRLKKEGDRVEKGTPIIQVDRKALEEKGIDMTTMVILTENPGKELDFTGTNKRVERGELIIKC